MGRVKGIIPYKFPQEEFTMNMKLFEIDEAIENFIVNNIDPETGEINNLEELEQLNALREDKLEAIALAYKNYSAEVTALKAEKKVFDDRIKKAEKSAESCKNYLAYALNGEKLKTTKVSVSYRTSTQVIVAPGTKLPHELLTFKEPEPNKTLLKELLKEGATIDGCSLETKSNIQIK